MAPQQRQPTTEWAPWWTFVDKDHVKCVWCKETFRYKRQRAFKHYGYGPGSVKCHCSKAPESVFRRFANCGGTIPTRMTHAEIYGSNATSSAATAAPCSSQSMHDGQFVEVPDPTGEERNSHLKQSESARISSRADSCTPRPMRQQGMTEAYQIGKRLELDEKWAAFFYKANVPFNVVRHPAFIAAVEATSKAGFEYNPPTYNAMRTKHIEPTRKHVQMQIEEKTKQCISLYGATICSDGWDNVVHRPLMNVMLVCPVGDVFLGSIDTTGNKKDKGYIAGKLEEYIEAVGPHNVVQICSDNASAMLGAMDKVVEDYPHIYKQGCAAHVIDLLLEDWGKEPTYKQLILMAKRICVFIKNRHMTLSLFRQSSPKLSLILPAETRFGCQFLMISRLLKVKAALLQVVVHEKWEEYVNSLFNRQNGLRSHALACLVRNTILDDTFWVRCENFVHLVEPAIVTLRTFDGQTPAMGRAWLAMNNLRKHVFGLRNAPFSLDPTIATRFEKQFIWRWKMMMTDLHYAGALLNPYLTDCGELQRSGTAKRARNRVLRHLSRPLGVNYNVVMDELTQFEERTGPYGSLEAPDIRETRMLPHQWWQRVGGDALPVIAKRILSLTCSASSCERNWSMYSFVHSKARNRLGVKKAEDLVYIYTNSKLLRERRGADPVTWYNNHPFSEDSDPDVGPVLVEEDNDDGGDDGWADGHDDGNGDARDDGDDVGDDNADVLEWEFDMDNAGGDRSDEEPQNQPNAGRAVSADKGVFDWSDFDEEPLVGTNRVVNDLQGDGIIGCNRANDDIDDEQRINEHHGDDDGNNDDGNAIGGDDDNDNSGGNDGGVQIPNEQEVANKDEVDQPCKAFEQNVEESTCRGESNETLARNVGSESPEVGQEEDVPIGQLFRTPLARSTPSIGATLAGLGRAPPSPSNRPPRHDSGKIVPPSLNSRASATSSGMVQQGGPSTKNRGVKRSTLGPKIVRPFYSGYTAGSSLFSPGVMGSRGINEDGITDSNKRRKIKKLVTTMVDGMIDKEVRNINSTVEEYAPNAYGDEDEVCGDDDESDGSDDSRAEVPNDEDIVVRAPVETPGTRNNPRRHSSRKKKD